MPTYVYKCAECDEVVDIFKSMNDPDPTLCNACGKNGLKQVFQPSVFRITGDGVFNPTTEWNKD